MESLLAAMDDGDSLPGARAAVAAEAAALAVRDEGALRAILERALGQQYDILRPLGRGATGAVFLARERALERFVAIKVLRPDLAEDGENRERFRREARVAAQLSHPSILPLYAFGEVDGLWYLVMGYVRGVSLAERLRLEGRLSCPETHRILTELSDALECAHRHGVVHRDIKPANILLDDESGRAMLADFGISKVQGTDDTLTLTGEIVGTPAYMSPEQALGERQIDERSDIYSLGAVGYVMLAGREPFAGVRADELLYRRLRDDPTPLRTVAPSVPEDLAAVVMRCLARDRTLRWASARELKAALGRTVATSASCLPEAVRDLPSFGPYAVLWVVAWTALAVLTEQSAGERALLMLVGLLVPVGLVLHVWNVGRHGLAPLELVRVACWPPEWWGMWWPRVLRRPGDLWARLPRPARLSRVVLSTFFVALPGLILARQWFATKGWLPAIDASPGWFAAAEGALVLGAAAVTAGTLAWALRHGLSVPEATRVLFGATAPSPAWSEPRIARLLTPGGLGVRPPERDAPADHRRAIDELVPLLSPDAAGVGTESSRVARRLLGAIEECNRQLGSLARDASPAELDRLTAQLTALDETSPREGDERYELRELVRHHLELVRRMRARQELMSEHRARLFDLMRALWTQLSLVRDAGGSAAMPHLCAQVRALCAEIVDYVEAAPPRAPAESRAVSPVKNRPSSAPHFT
ncbi:MAG TPA: protein kinase [Solirubrobacteraceae bacterium]|nr:protein kinase [Solirubrobacteraceae bacterium]